jgi:hypothetical protein
VRALATLPGGIEASTSVRIVTASPALVDGGRGRALDPYRRRDSLWHEWADPERQRSALLGLLRTVCIPQVDVRSDKRTPHHRELVLTWRDGDRLAIRLDHGLSFFFVKREKGTSMNFPFDAALEIQLKRLREAKFTLVNETSGGPRIYAGALTRP